MTDLELIQNILAGQKFLFKELILKYQTTLFNYVRSFHLRPEVIEDMAQDIFMKKIRH